MYKTVKYWTSPEGIPEENIHTISEFFSPVTSKAHEFLSSDKLKTFCNSAGLVTFGGAAVLGNWKLVNSSIDRSLVPINSKLDHIGNQNIELIKEVHFIKDRLNLTEKDRLPEKDCDKQG
ncbi:4526_t:CDS:2 [Rhizophagus irregularis]|nr:4526_t:CDS:2 [Rhizophagus irregularis]